MRTNTSATTATTAGKTVMRPTRNPINAGAREALAGMLNTRLADSIDLRLQVKQAHWNMQGPSFIALHELYDQIADSVNNAVDDIAERIVQLGGVAAGSLQQAASNTTLDAYPNPDQWKEHVEAVAKALAAVSAACVETINAAEEHDDPITADLFTRIGGEIDKHLWMVESHLQG